MVVDINRIAKDAESALSDFEMISREVESVCDLSISDSRLGPDLSPQNPLPPLNLDSTATSLLASTNCTTSSNIDFQQTVENDDLVCASSELPNVTSLPAATPFFSPTNYSFQHQVVSTVEQNPIQSFLNTVSQKSNQPLHFDSERDVTSPSKDTDEPMRAVFDSDWFSQERQTLEAHGHGPSGNTGSFSVINPSDSSNSNSSDQISSNQRADLRKSLNKVSQERTTSQEIINFETDPGCFDENSNSILDIFF